MTDVHCSYLGTATIFQGGSKVEVMATLFTTDDGFWFGHYRDADPGTVTSGRARIRFHDASEADAALAAVDPDNGGFRLTSQLVELRRA
jgi:hypothetical protein